MSPTYSTHGHIYVGAERGERERGDYHRQPRHNIIYEQPVPNASDNGMGRTARTVHGIKHHQLGYESAVALYLHHYIWKND